jgi:phosphoglycolate phosphatase
MKPYELVIFDWDGTVMDSAAKIVSCMQLAAEACDMPVPSAEAVSHIIGISLHPAIKQLFAIDDDVLVNDLVLAYKEIFLSKDATPSPLFNGAERLFSTLKEHELTLAVATGKARRGLERAWLTTNTRHYFSYSRCADEAQSKPSPDMLQQLLALSGVDVSQAVMIGDTTYDMQMAQAIGMDRIGVSYGVHAQLHLENHRPKAIVHDISELTPLLINV